MPERSFHEEVAQLRIGREAPLREGILAVTKALLNRVSPMSAGIRAHRVSALVDVLSDASDLLEELGIHPRDLRERSRCGLDAQRFDQPSDPRRGNFSSIVGTNVAADAISDPRRRSRRWRADDCRRGLRAKVQHHSGAEPCDRD